ncbi:MAG: hypothetical protein KGN76_12195 [Acidobacteriota bacterium]|nr:hypothetical protein [Acidobacteriota bacterium]
MPRLVLNDEDYSLEKQPESWGELLEFFERDASTRGEVVTAVRFDGVEEPTFRGRAVVERPLGEVELVEVETATPGDLIDEALAQGASAIASLVQATGRTGEAFRGADLVGANQQLAELGEAIRSLISILNTGAVALGVSLDRMEWNGRPVSMQLSELVGQLESIIDAQQAHDWLTVADILEYDFQPALSTWGPVFHALREQIPAA